MKAILKALLHPAIATIIAMVGCCHVFTAHALPRHFTPDNEIEAIAAELISVAPELAQYLPDSLLLQQVPYIDVTYTDEERPPYSLDEFCKKAGTVVFKVNKTYIEPGNPFLTELRTNLLGLIRQQKLQLYRIDVRGAASPEGPIRNNQRLAIGRANTLRDSITAILPSAEGNIIRMSSVTEDYELLIHYMRQAGDPDTPLVQNLYDKWSTTPERLKAALMSAKNRTLWPRLLKEYFPQLRATRVILYFHIDPEQEPVVPEPVELEPIEPTFSTEPAPVTPVVTPIEVIDTIHRRPVLAIGTNLIYDLWYMPDFGFAPMWNGRLEWYPYSTKHNFWNHTSLAVAFVNPYWHKWAKHKFYQIRNYEIEGRLYHRYEQLTGQRYGWYVGAAIENNIFGIGLSDHRGWQGEGLGFQVTGGYVLPLDKCKSWKLEFNLGAGFYETHYDPYIYDDPYAGTSLGHGEYNPPTVNPSEGDKLHYYYKWYGAAKDFKKRQWRYRWIGPMQVGVNIKYDILWKRQQHRGISFRHTEERKEMRYE